MLYKSEEGFWQNRKVKIKAIYKSTTNVEETQNKKLDTFKSERELIFSSIILHDALKV